MEFHIELPRVSGDVRAQLVVISIAPVTQAIWTTVVKTLRPHDLDVKDHTLTGGFVIPTVGKFAMCKSIIQTAIHHKPAHNT